MDYEEMEKKVYLDNKNYNLPPYGSTNVTWIYHPFDIFDINYWNPKAAWFTGFHPDDRNKIRPMIVLHFAIPLLIFIIPIPADTFSVVSWIWNYALRSNITLTMMPFLLNQTVPANDMLCLPTPPRVPDPRYGCHWPLYELVPPNVPPERLEEMFTYGICAPYFWPWKQFEAFLQLIITPLVKTWILPSNPSILNFFNYVESIPIIGIKLYNDATGLPGTDALPLGMWQCLMVKVPMIILMIVAGALVSWFILLSLIKNIRLALVEGGVVDVTTQMDDIKAQQFITNRTIQFNSFLLSQYINRVNKFIIDTRGKEIIRIRAQMKNAEPMKKESESLKVVNDADDL